MKTDGASAVEAKRRDSCRCVSVFERTPMELDDHLKDLMKQLGAAINESLSESESVSAAMSEIREAGYDVFLVLEATIGFQKRGTENPEMPAAIIESGDLVLNAQDAKFLKAMKICLGNAGPSLPENN
jgi:hypothetical protein